MTALRTVGMVVWNLPRDLLVLFIRAWRLLISPLYGPTCKYYPSCSAYGLEAVRRHGAVRGSALTVWRILRCNPWSDGGVDDVPPARPRRGRDHGPGSPAGHGNDAGRAGDAGADPTEPPAPPARRAA
jgi:putative membrane protein insertion efficiency factor